MTIHIKRVYDPVAEADGNRILVDRLWPRGLSRDSAKIDFWAKDVASSSGLRKWYRHEPAKWHEFKEKYFAELDCKHADIEDLIDRTSGIDVTFVYSSQSPLNNAVALQEYLVLKNP